MVRNYNRLDESMHNKSDFLFAECSVIIFDQWIFVFRYDIVTRRRGNDVNHLALSTHSQCTLRATVITR